jgi:hypothetical protein
MALVASVVLFATAFPGGMATGSPLAAATSVSLGNAASFAVLGGQTVTNTGPSVIHGNLGVSPGSAVVGFTGPPQGTVNGVIHAADQPALDAQNSVITAYNALLAQPCDVNLTGQDLAGQTLVPGVYCFSSSAFLTGVLTLNGLGNPSAVWVFKIVSTLITSTGSSVPRVSLTNGATSCNVFWQIGSSATLGTGSNFVGNILALTSIDLDWGANISGRALARNGAVTLHNNNVDSSTCTTVPTNTPIGVAPTATPTATATTVAAAATATAAAVATAKTAVSGATPIGGRPVLAQTPAVVSATELPRTGGDPYGIVMIWLALGGAGIAMLGYSIRRRSR